MAAGCGSSGGGGGGAATATLSGTILGPGGQGLQGALVQVEPVTALQGGSNTKQAVTDIEGNFIVADSPTGMVHVHIDGSGVAGGNFASLELTLTIGAGQAVLPQTIVLPDLDNGETVDVAVDGSGMTTGDSTVGDPLVDGFSLEIPTGTTILLGGAIPGGPVPVNVTPVPAMDTPMPLPGALNPSSFVSIQPPDALFSPALTITLPNTDGLPLGTLVDIWSFDHDLGAWVNRSQETGNQGMVVDIGGTEFIVANEVITEGGWHAPVIDVDPACATTIAGQVFIEGSNSVPLANVLISLSTGQFGITGADGRFSIPNVPAYDAGLLPKTCMAADLELRGLGPVSHGAHQVFRFLLAQDIVTGGTTNWPPFDIVANDSGSVVGSVEDAAGAPVDGTVEIAGPDSVSVATSLGSFFATGLAPGNYTATFEFPSKLSDIEPFTIVSNQQTTVRLVEPGGTNGTSTIVRVVDLTEPGVVENVAGACVTLVGNTGAPLFRIASAAGIAEFENAPAGPYTVTAQVDTPLAPAGTQRSASTIVGVNALGNPPTILLPFFDLVGQQGPITTDAMLDGTVQNVPVGTQLEYQLAEGVSGFSDSGPADAGFLADIPSGRPIDVGVVAVDPLTGRIVSGIFVADVQATPGQTVMLDFDFGSASAHPFDLQNDLLYTNVQTQHANKAVELALGDLAFELQPGPDLPDPLFMPDLARAKFADFQAALIFSTTASGLPFEASFCDQPLTFTPSTMDVPFIGPPTIVSPANNASFPDYGPGSVVDFDLGTGAGTGPGFNWIMFFHEAKASGLFTNWDILVSPGTVLVTLPPVFPNKPMFVQGFAGVNVETLRFVFPGFAFANFFDVNLPANVEAVMANRVCGAIRGHFFTVGLPLQSAPPVGLARRAAARPNRFE